MLYFFLQSFIIQTDYFLHNSDILQPEQNKTEIQPSPIVFQPEIIVSEPEIVASEPESDRFDFTYVTQTSYFLNVFYYECHLVRIESAISRILSTVGVGILQGLKNLMNLVLFQSQFLIYQSMKHPLTTLLRGWTCLSVSRSIIIKEKVRKSIQSMSYEILLFEV